MLALAPACSPDVTTDGHPAWDRDGDTISVAVEVDSMNSLLYQFDPTRFDLNPSRAIGTPSSGSLTGGLNLPDTGTGYYHYQGTDTIPYTDDWGTLALMNTIEDGGRCWRSRAGRRAGIGDLSLRNGGEWADHESHENGRDADARYVRIGGAAQDTFPLDLRTEPGQLDTNAAIALWDCIHRSPRVEFLIIDSVYFRPLIQNHPKLRFDTSRVHANHFHVRILDPDGNN